MSRTATTGAFQGFSVVQPFLGAPLQWLPALGTQELDDMINAFLPGPSSIQDKRAHISMDFFEYCRQTGETFKYYPVASSSSSFASTNTSSPASSAALYDSGYASNYNVSPVIAESQWAESPAAYTPVTFDETTITSSSSKRLSPSSSRQRTTDFSNHPGMRILTKDGRDVTNSASRGCKTKEQRDHAHLMRIIKACDSCRRKKIRCDPSHKKRAASQASSPTEQKTSKKSKKKAADPPPAAINEFSLDFLNTETFDFDLTFGSLETPAVDDLDAFIDQFVQQDADIFANDYINYIPDDLNFYNDPISQVSPRSGSASTTPPQAYTPYTPTPPGPSPPTVVYEAIQDTAFANPPLPYLNPGVPRATDYADFNLFSPPADFLLDEEPVPVQKTSRSRSSAVPGAQQQQSPVVKASSDGSHHDIAPQPDGSPGVEYFGTDQWFSLSPQHSDFSPDGHGLASGVGVSQQSYSPSLQSAAGRRPEESYYGVQSSASRSVQSRVTAQSTVTAAVSCGPGQNGAAPSVPVSPSLGLSTPPPRISSSQHSPVSTGLAQTLFDSSPAATPVSYHPVESQNYGGVDNVSRAPAHSGLVRTVHANVGDSSESVSVAARANVAGPVAGPLTGGPHAGLQTAGVVAPDGVDVVGSSMAVVLATTLLSTLPVRRLLTGDAAAKRGKTVTSSSSSLLSSSSQLVVLGLVSCLLLCCFFGGAQWLGSHPDFLNTLITVTSVSVVAMMTVHERLSSVADAVSFVGSPNSIVDDNVKPKGMQAAGQMMHDLQCTIRRRARSLTRRISVPRLASL